jgi:hypothetical protein
MEHLEYVWVAYEITKNKNEYILGIFTSEILAIKVTEATEEFNPTSQYRIERFILNP